MKLVDVLGKRTKSKDALPSRHRICAHYWMYSTQRSPNVLWTTPFFFVNFNFLWVCFSGSNEAVPDESCSQTLEESLVSFREAVIDFISRSPECVASRLW